MEEVSVQETEKIFLLLYQQQRISTDIQLEIGQGLLLLMSHVYRWIDAITLDKTATVVVDIESLAQSAERSSGSPKVTRVLSRKWSYRTERLPSTEEEHVDESSKRTLVRVNSELEALKLSLVGNKTLPPTIPCLSGSGTSDAADGWNKRLHRLMAINPRKVLCIFATVSSMGTLMLIYFTLAIDAAL